MKGGLKTMSPNEQKGDGKFYRLACSGRQQKNNVEEKELMYSII